MVAPPKTDGTNENPIKLMSEEEIREYYSSRTFDFNNSENPRPEYAGVDLEYAEQDRRLDAMLGFHPIRAGVSREVWDRHTDLVHDYFRNPRLLQNYYICKNKAFLKLCEIFEVFNFDFFKGNELRTFHLCEGPGYFIEATYIAFLRHYSHKNCTWTWAANTLNPYFENLSPLKKLVDDSHIKGHEHRWIFGPSDDGDVKKLDEDYLIKNGLAGTFDLVTADGSTTSDDPDGRKEQLVAPIIDGEVTVALSLLRTGGRFIIKVYRFSDPYTRVLLHLLASSFSSIKAFKPMASRPGSSEKYLVCDGFGGGKCKVDNAMMIACDEMFLKLQLDQIKYHCDSYGNQKYQQRDKNMFLEAMKPKLFSFENASLRKELHKYFPVGHSKKPSPWKDLYGDNLVRRLQDRDATLMAIEYYICTIFLTSNIQLKVNDTLFVDAHAFYSMRNTVPDKSIHYDLFEDVSTTKNVLESDWRLCMDFSDRNVVVDKSTLQNQITIQHILVALEHGFKQGMDTFTLRNFHRHPYSPLFLSRLSASMFALFFILFDRFTIEDESIRWSGKKYPAHASSIGPLLHRLCKESLLLPENTSIRSFIPMSVLEMFHGHICWRNIVNMMQVKRKYEEIQSGHQG